MSRQTQVEKRARLKKRIRAKIEGTAERPRVSVFRSNAHIYGQLIDDESGKTLVSASDIKMAAGKKRDHAKEVGVLLAKNATAKGITKVVFDRNGFKFTGRVKEFAEALRAGGLKF